MTKVVLSRTRVPVCEYEQRTRQVKGRFAAEASVLRDAAHHALTADEAEHTLTAEHIPTAERTLTAEHASTAEHALTAERVFTPEHALTLDSTGEGAVRGRGERAAR